MTTADVHTDSTDGFDPAPMRPMQASLAARLAAGSDVCAFTFAGQGWAWWDALPALIEHRDDLGRPARVWAGVIADLLRTPEFRDQGRISFAFDPVGWATGLRDLPDEGQLTQPSISFAGTLYAQLLGYRALWIDGLAGAVDAGAVVGAAGHSAGALAAAAISEQPDGIRDSDRLAKHLELALRIGHGMAADRLGVGPAPLGAAMRGEVDTELPMVAVSGIRVDRLEAVLAEHPGDVRIGLRHGPFRCVITGTIDEVNDVRRRLAALTTAAGKPVKVSFEPLAVGGPGHHPILDGAARKVAARCAEVGVTVNADAFTFPVISGVDHEPYQGDSTYELIASVVSKPLAWDEAVARLTRSADGATVPWILDLGPGDGVARLTAAAARGSGSRVLPLGVGTGKRQFFATGAYPAPAQPYEAFAPTVVELPDGTQRLENRFTRATGRSPMILPGMTPTTVDAGIVAAAANAGFMAELAGGGQVSARIFDLRMQELTELLEPGQEIVFNTLHLDPYLWGLHLGKDRLVQAARRAGAPICGVTISAGLPEVDAAVALLDELSELGIWLNAFKPGTVDQIRQVVAIAEAAPHHTVFAHVEGGTAGGHHSWEDLEDLLLHTYHQLRSTPNIVICVGGGVGDADRAAELLSGEWALRHGSVLMPVDGILFGTVAMACAEATATPSVKEALATAGGTTGFVAASKVGGGVTSGRSGLNADIHFLDNAASRCAALLDAVAGDADKVDERRTEIVEALARTAKPYFGDLATLTYTEMLRRFVELTALGRDGRYEDGAWLDVTHRNRFLELLQRSEARLDLVDEGEISTEFSAGASVDDPDAAIERLRASHPSADDTVLHPADTSFFIEVCKRPGKPVPFVPVVDADVRRWYQSDSLWQAQHPAFDADQVLIIPGPVAVAGIDQADIGVADLLGEFERSVMASMLSDGAEPVSVDRLRRHGPTELVTGPVAVLGEVDTVSRNGLAIPNPALAMGSAEQWLGALDADARLLSTVLTVEGIEGAEERAVATAHGDDVELVLEIPSLEDPAGQRLTLKFRHVHHNGVDSVEVDDTAWSEMLEHLLRTTLLDGSVDPVALGEDARFTTTIDGTKFTAHASLVGLDSAKALPDGWLGVSWPAVFATLGAPELVGGLLDLVHLEHRVETLGDPADPPSVVTVSARVVAVTEHAAGCRIDTEAVICDEATGAPAAVLGSSFLIRGATVPAGLPAGLSEEPSAGDDSEIETRPRLTVASATVTAPDCMDSFAAISGDHNPIHRSVLVARLVGLGEPIVHGAWTSAVAQRVLIDGMDARPERLRSWSVRFLAPVLLRDELKITATRRGVRHGSVVVDVDVVAVRADGNVPVLTATAEVAPPRTAYLFPGQGIQRENMGMDGYARSAAAKKVWDRADAYTREHLGFSILQIVRENPRELATPNEVFRHPGGVLHLTQFTQVAMATLASAQIAEMRERGSYVEGAVCAGHSVGEYNALAAVAGVLPLESVVELVFQRGLAMHHLVPRDAAGNSNYRLGVVRPHEISMSHAELETLVASLRDELGEALEIVNFNLRGKQYAVAGTVNSLDRLESVLLRRLKPGSKPVFLLVPGIDVPFHSSVLRDGVAEFRRHLDAGVPPTLDPALLVGRYIPNLVPRSFNLERDYVEEVADYTGSEQLAAILADWESWAQRPGELTREFVIELMAWQFASPVRWIETQDLLFTPIAEGGFGIEQVVEIGLGSAPTVANLARGTLALADHAGLRPVVHNLEGDALVVFGDDEDPEPVSDESDDGGSEAPAAVEVPVAAEVVAAPAPAPSAGGGGSVDDLPLSTADALSAMLSIALKIRRDQLGPVESIDDLVDGVSSRRNQLLMDLGAEFGVAGVDGAQELPIDKLAAELVSRAPRYSAPGPVLRDARETSLASVLGPVGAKSKDVAARVGGHWQLGPGWVDRVLFVLALDGRAADSARGGALGRLHPLPSTADALIDAAVTMAAADAGVSVAPPATDGGGAVDAAAVAELEDRLAGPGGLLASVARGILDKTGADDGMVPAEDPDSVERRRRLAALDAEHGEERAKAVAPRFDDRRHVVFSSWWSMARHDVVALHHDSLRALAGGDGAPNPDDLDAEAARLAAAAVDPGVAASALWFGDRARERGDLAAAARFDTILAGTAVPVPVPSVRPAVEIDPDGDLVVTEEPAPADRVTRLLDGLPVDAIISDALRRSLNEAVDLSGETALVTGASPGGIAFEVVRRLLRGGATVVCTTTTLTPERLDDYRELYRSASVPGAELHVVPANMASFADVDALVDWMVSPVESNAGGVTRTLKAPMRPTLVLPFAAGGVSGELPDAGPDAEVAMRTLLWSVERLVGRLSEALARMGAGGQRCHVVLPASPNHGTFGGDGAYGEAKAALDAMVNKWTSESDRWGSRVTLAQATIGWVRGTGLMDANGAAGALVEERLGLRTFSAAEMAWLLASLFSPEAKALAEAAPLQVVFDGGLGDIEIRTALDPLRDELAEQVRSARKAAAGRSDVSTTIPALPSPVRPPQHSDRVAAKPGRPLDQMVVVLGAAELGPWGGSATRFDLEVDGALSAGSVTELAWTCGLIRWDGASTPAGWVDSDTGESVPEHEVADRYRDEVHARCGIREFEVDPILEADGVPLLVEVFLENDMTMHVATHEEALAMAAADPEHIRVGRVPGGDEWRVTRLAGSRIRVPRMAKLSRKVGAQIPVGFDPTAWGIPGEMASSVDRVSLWNLVATVEAFLDAGIEPEELMAWVHPTRVGSSQGTGMGGATSLRSMYVDGLLATERPNDLLQEALGNVIAAYVVQSYVGGYGPMIHPVGACATAAVSIEVAADKILAGKADVMVAGGFDDLSTEGVEGFGAMNATAPSDFLEAAGLAPHQYSRANDRRRAGFVEGQGGGTVLLARASLAAELALPVRGVVVFAASFADGIHTSIPAPGLGALSCVTGGARSPLGQALADHGLAADDIGVISKHDTSTNANDPNESDLHHRIATELGRSVGNPLLTVSQKTVTGHAKGGAAIFQTIGLMQVLDSGEVPGNRNLECVEDSHRDHTHLVYGHRTISAGEPLRAGILTSLGFGHVSAVVCLAHSSVFLAAMDPARRETYVEQATQRRLAGLRRLMAGRYGGEAPYRKRSDRRLGVDGSEAKAAEAAMLLDPTARLGPAGAYVPGSSGS